MRKMLGGSLAVVTAVGLGLAAASAADLQRGALVVAPAPPAGVAVVAPLENLIGPGFGPGGCLTTTLPGATDLEFCPNEYHFEAGDLFCSGVVRVVNAGYTLLVGGCNSRNQVFLGGRMVCGRGNYCDWTPAPPTRSAGLVTERVRVYYPKASR